jgi:hypothetical protein
MSNNKNVHDIKSAISALTNAMELITEEWDKSPELVDRIIPLSIEKLKELQKELDKYHQ